ncbi:MAG: sugar MFS transporter [Acidobacteriota bacterium]|jgi:FHS family L-fucose permease-like MFS transporter
MATETRHRTRLASPGFFFPFIAVTALFFIFGFVTNLNMGLVPDLKKIFEIQKLATWQAMLANFAFFTAFFVFSTPASRLIEAIGYKGTIVVSLFVQVVGALMFLPAAKMVSFPLFLAAIFVVGAGVTALQTAANPYVAILGPEDSAPVRLNLAQAANSLGGTIAPWIAGTFILTSEALDPAQVAKESAAVQHAYQVAIANTVRIPYLIIAIGLVILGIAVAFTRLPHIEAKHHEGAQAGAAQNRSIWAYRHTVLGALGIFLYVGVEVGLATTMVLYFSDSLHGGLHVLAVAEAQKLVLFYWLGALVGRLLGSWMLTMIKAGKLLGVFGVIAAALVVVSTLSSGYVAIAALILAGFFNSIMFPNIFALGIAGLGPMTSRGSGLIMTAIVGGALIPVAIGWVVDRVSYQWALVIPMICYIYIAWYGMWGSKPATKEQLRAAS